MSLLVAGCDTASEDRAGPEARAPSSPTPSAVAPSPGQVRLALTTHCGVVDAVVDGVHWRAEPPLGNGNPPDGWGNPETAGRWHQTGETTAVFLADSGVTASFVRSGPPDPARGCA